MSGERRMPPWFRARVAEYIAEALESADRDGYTPPLLVEQEATR